LWILQAVERRQTASLIKINTPRFAENERAMEENKAKR
jgi:hypothetical protein